ncbi:lipoprotein [Streptomyces griseosporeus]|uniref:lipoprotein n=1 Tax=Streptomyces griseosporeus TaxID=1910 RepID=UPI0036FCC311
MRGRTGAGWRGAAQVLLLAGVLAGCGGSSGDEGGRPPASASATAAASGQPSAPGAASPAASGGRIGAAGSACRLPVTFDTARGWKAEAIESPKPSGSPANEFAEDLGNELVDGLLRQGPVTAVCEIDAKPAGNIGFLRVWKGEPGDADARGVLQGFVTAEEGARHATYRTFTSGGLTGARVDYEVWSELLEESKKECALAVVTSHGPVVLHLGGMDDDEHEEMLPAFELAQRTLRTA